MTRATPSVVNHSHVIVFPPIIPLTGFLLGLALEWVIPLRSHLPRLLVVCVRPVGAALFVVGIAGFVWMVVTMKSAGTPIHNSRTPVSLVERGPFQFSRNPMYLFGSISYAGLALLLLQPWPLLLLIGVVIVMHYGVVLREETFLARHFGDAYRTYTERVPRYF